MSTTPSDEVLLTPDRFVQHYNMLMHDRGIRFPQHLWPLVCGLCDERIRKLAMIIGPGSGKSTVISQIYPALKLGYDPMTTILGVSGGEALMHGFMHSVMETIEFNSSYRSLFPYTRPDKAAGWSTERGLYVTGRRPGDADASFWAGGLKSKTLTGKHGREIICDDLHDDENSSSEAACEDVVGTYYRVILGRADPRGARFLVSGRRWHENDIYGHLQREGDFVTLVLPAERPGSTDLYVDVTVPDGLKCVFTDGKCKRWTPMAA